MPTRKKPVRRKKAAASSLGLSARDTAHVESADLAKIASAIESDGGAVLARYRDPVGGKPLLLASLPVEKVEPTPYHFINATPRTLTSSA